MRMKTPTSPGGREPHSSNFTKRGGSPTVSGVIDRRFRRRIVKLARDNPVFRRALGATLTAMVREAASKKEKSMHGLHRKHVSKLMEFGGRIGVISPQKKGGSDSDHRVARANFLADLKRLGYRKASPLKGEWGGIPAGSYLIENVRPEDLYELGRKYDQESVVYKPRDGILGVYYLTGDPRAEVVMMHEGDPILQGQADGTEFSKARGLELEHGYLWGSDIPWDGRLPVTRRDIRRMLRRRDLEQQN
jgi:hypothetical protein